MMSYLVTSSHCLYISHPLYCKIYLDFYSYFRLFWETSRHNTVQQWNNNADSIERRHSQAKTQSGKWAPGSINNYHSWDMLLIQWGGSLCSAFLNSSESKSARFHQGEIKDALHHSPMGLVKYWFWTNQVWLGHCRAIPSTFCLWDGSSKFSAPMKCWP